MQLPPWGPVPSGLGAHRHNREARGGSASPTSSHPRPRLFSAPSTPPSRRGARRTAVISRPGSPEPQIAVGVCRLVFQQRHTSHHHRWLEPAGNGARPRGQVSARRAAAQTRALGSGGKRRAPRGAAESEHRLLGACSSPPATLGRAPFTGWIAGRAGPGKGLFRPEKRHSKRLTGCFGTQGVETGGQGGARGLRSGGKPGPRASTAPEVPPDAVHSGPPPPRPAALAPGCTLPEHPNMNT